MEQKLIEMKQLAEDVEAKRARLLMEQQEFLKQQEEFQRKCREQQEQLSLMAKESMAKQIEELRRIHEQELVQMQQEARQKQDEELHKLREALLKQAKNKETSIEPEEVAKGKIPFHVYKDESNSHHNGGPSKSLHNSVDVSERKSSLLEDTAMLLHANSKVITNY